jgi:hypothetical protein
VLNDDLYWNGVSARILAANDPRLSEMRLDSMHAALPARILEASAACVAAATERGDDAFATELLAIIEDAGFPFDALASAQRVALGPLLSTARTAVRDLLTRLGAAVRSDGRTDESVLVGIWQEAASTVVPTLQRLRGLAPPTGDASVLADDVAELLDGLATRLYNETDRIDLMLDVSAAAYEAAESDLVRERLRQELRTVRLRACNAALERVRTALAHRDAEAAARSLDEARSHADDDASRAAVEAASRVVRAMRPAPQTVPDQRPPARSAPTSTMPTRPLAHPHADDIGSLKPGRGLAFLAAMIAVAIGMMLIVGSYSGQPSPATRPTPTPTAQIAGRPTEPPPPPPPAFQPPPLPTAIPVPTFTALPLPPLAPTAAAPTPVPSVAPTVTLERVLVKARVSGAGPERLRLRQTPSRDGYVIDGLDDGEVLDVIEEPREIDGVRWVRVRTRNLTRGHVSAQFLIPADSTATPAPTATRPAPTPTAAFATPVTSLPTAPAVPPTSTPVIQNPFPSTPVRPSAVPMAPTAPRATTTITPRPQPTTMRGTPTRTPTPRPAPDSLQQFTGNGDSRTSRFRLGGGDYVISWRVRATSAGSSGTCSIRGELRDADDEESWDFESETARGAGEMKGETRAHDVPGGTYLVEIDSFSIGAGCSWEITVAPDRRR